ncbi:MAG: hypothetical protein KC483_11430 [Nitrosarchaeum sp.]|nr:hypothetical protein [Nitrosarchaeum sp.]
MLRKCLMFLFTITIILSFAMESNYSYGLKTGSYNFCETHPAFPECVGWRTTAIEDSFNHWFCSYVNLPKICEIKPEPEKEIALRNNEFCCRFIGPEIKSKMTTNSESPELDQKLNRDSPDSSIAPLIIWTDKDHYNFKDKVTIYGKFDFSSFKIKKSVSEKEFDQTGREVNATSIQTGRIISETPVLDVDIELNGRKILRNVPVNENGWFVSFFYLNDRYHFANQNNILEVDYLLYKDVPLGGPRTHSTYHFTTGDISKKDQKFNVWLDNSLLPKKVRFGVDVDNPEKFITFVRHNLVITRLTTPEGFVIPIESNFSVQDLSKEYTKFLQHGHGTYEIQVTYGENNSKILFEY